MAEDVPGEVTVNEAFDDSTYETGLTISGGNLMYLFIVVNKTNMELQVVL